MFYEYWYVHIYIFISTEDFSVIEKSTLGLRQDENPRKFLNKIPPNNDICNRENHATFRTSRNCAQT